MQKVCIFLFSGTGMTRYVIGKLKSELEANQVRADVHSIESTHAGDVRLDGYDAICIAYPVHSFNAPKIVVDFAKRLPKTGVMDAFVVATAGESAPVNFAASKLLIGILRKKGFNVFYDRQFAMPGNFIVKDGEAKARRKIDAVNAEIPKTARDIINRTAYRQKSSFFVSTLAVLGRAEWLGAKWMGKLFYADKSCARCGMCAQSCPNRNIIVTEKRVSFKWKCGLCMRCFYACPKQALNARWPFRGVKLKDWYDHDALQAVKKWT